jgi:hypothetical protein
LLFGVVEKSQCEVKEAGGHAGAVDANVLLVEMPAARAQQERRSPFVESILLARLTDEVDRAAHGRMDVQLAADLVLPGRRVRVFKVRHVGIRARVQRVDHHLPFHRTGDFHPTAGKRRGKGRDGPASGPDLGRFREEVGLLAGVDPMLAFDPGAQERLAPGLEGTVERGHERHGLGRQDGLESLAGRAENFNSGRHCVTHGRSLVCRAPNSGALHILVQTDPRDNRPQPSNSRYFLYTTGMD